MAEPAKASERQVGRVVGVSNYKVTVLLDQDIRSQVRAYPRRVTLVTEIGGYLLFPVAPGESAVGIVVGAFEDEAVEPDPDKAMSLQLTRARRTLRVNLLGQLFEGRPFVPGISVYPTLETPALLPTERELGDILQYQPREIDGDRDAALDVGVSPIYVREPVTVSYNDFLARPLGVIGNTGSGKSCSVASVIREALGLCDDSAAQAKFIILDINGEYNPVFPPGSGPAPEGARELNSAYVDGGSFSLPLWSFNLAELISFFEASQASQVPVLERVLAAARENAIDEGPRAAFRHLVRLADRSLEHLDALTGYADKPTDMYAGRNAKSILDHLESSIGEIAAPAVPEAVLPAGLAGFAPMAQRLRGELASDYNITPAAAARIRALASSVRADLETTRDTAVTQGGLMPITADSPIPFDPRILLKDHLFESAISRFRGQQRIQEYIATLRLRIHRQMADKRWSVFTGNWETSLPNLLNTMTGGDNRRVTVVDCSMLAHDVLPFFCAVFGRLLLEMRAHSEAPKRIAQPFVLVLEEAHNYLKPRREGETFGSSLARDTFERIAKEGRKFGLSLIIASQRPSDVSATVLSQCANFVVHRIQNPEDIDYFKKILPTGSRDLLDQLPILAPGDAILVGSAVNVPARVKVKMPRPRPDSDTPRPWSAWQAGKPKFEIEASCEAWANETGEGSHQPGAVEPAAAEARLSSRRSRPKRARRST